MKKLGRIFTSRVSYHLYFWIFFFGLMFLSSGAKNETIAERVVHSLEYIAFLIVPVYIHFFILNRFF